MISRRTFLPALAAATAAAQPPRDYTGQTPTRYPDPDIISLDKRFDKYKIGNTPILRLHTGTLWAEGPAWNGVGRYLVWSDIPNDRQMRWLEEDGHTSVFRQPVGYTNGNTFDYEGRQISCEHGNRRMVRREYNGQVTVLASKWNGKQLNAPNDVVVAADGAIWFTDPGYGALMHYEGHKGSLEIKEAVYRIDGKTGNMTMVTDEIFKPNGLCFSPDYKKLYIADTGATHYEKAPREIKVWDVDGAKLKNGKTFVSMVQKYKGANGQTVEGAGLSDGIRCDTEGNIWSSAGWVGAGYDGVHIFAQDGHKIGAILLPEICSNLCFGGAKRNRLFMTGSQSLYTMYVEAQGAGIA